MELRTERLLLRQFRDSDLEPLIAMGQDPVVMQHFVSMMSREETVAMYGRIKEHWQKYGYGVFAIEVPDETAFAGFIGFTTPKFEASFTPCTEILWRLPASAHNKGYCTEAARTCIKWGLHEKGFKEIFAYTTASNIASWKVMEKAGMKHIGEFDHPQVEEGHPLRRKLLYRVSSF
jgi:RimJ/RimL family protein N-acetyltransferase